MATATYSGTNYALQNTPVVATLPNAATAGGIVYCSSDIVYSTATAGAGSHFLCGKLPKGAVVLYSIVWPIDTATFGAPDALASAATGVMGVAGDTDLFGDIADMNASALAQTIAPKPDGTTVTTLLKPLTEAKNVYITSAAQNIVDTEGISVKIFYTVAGN